MDLYAGERALGKVKQSSSGGAQRHSLSDAGGGFPQQAGLDAQLSDDLAQETFIKAYLNITKFRGLSSFSTWLMRIAYNVFYDDVRKRKVESEELKENTQVAGSPLTSQLSPLTSSLKMDIYAALALLKPDERTCITLQLIDGYPIDEISKITGIPDNTVKSHLRRGKEKMTVYLKENGYDR